MLLYALNLLDLGFTLYAVSNDATELNPLMRNVPIMIVYKTIVVGALCWWLGTSQEKIAQCGLRVCTAVYATINLWHALNILIGGI